MFGFMIRPFRGARPSAAPTNHEHSTQGVRDTRREIVLMAVRDTLRKNAVPPNAVTAEVLPAATSSKARGVHLRLVVKDPEARLMPFAQAFQVAVQTRIRRLDPLSVQWLAGVSWVIEASGQEIPPLPPASYWQVPRPWAAQGAPEPGARARLDRIFESTDAASPASRPPDFAPTLPMLFPRR